MGFIKSIGSFVNKAAGFVGKAADVAGKVAGGLGKITDFLKKPLSEITKPLSGLVGKALDKLPFGIGKFIKPFADKFMQNGLSALAQGPLAGLGKLASKMPDFGKLADLAKTVSDVAGKVQQDVSPEGKLNFQNIFAQAQAALIK